MPKTKKKLLPKNFEDLLKSGNLAELQQVFEICDLNARGGYSKQTALAFDECPDELAQWLVAKGADLAATDSTGNTPLHTRARIRQGRIHVLIDLGADVNSNSSSIGTPLHAAAASHKVENSRLLLARGAQPNALNKAGLTPLEVALYGCSNSDIEDMALLADALLSAGASKTPRMKNYVNKIGKQFEFMRNEFNPEHVAATSAALNRLYAIFDVAPVPPHVLHDGKSPINIKAGELAEQHQELWEKLVPPMGPAKTLQGEVIRITGRIHIELYGNGGINWDADFKKMADVLIEYFRQGKPLSPSEIDEVVSIIPEVKRKNGDYTHRLAELAVAWVLLNPDPILLNPPPYKR